MAESHLKAVEVAADCVNGDLREPIFKRLLNCAAEVLSVLPRATSSKSLGGVGTFLAAIFAKSSEKEKNVLAKILHDDHRIMVNLFGVICSLWKRGECMHVFCKEFCH